MPKILKNSKSKVVDWSIPKVDETKFVSEMYVPQLTVTHYDNDTILEMAKFLKEKYNLSDSLIKTENCHVVNGVVVEREPLKGTYE